MSKESKRNKSYHNQHERKQEELMKDAINIHGSVEVHPSQDSTKQHIREREEDKTYKEFTRGHENATRVLTTVTMCATVLYLIATCAIFWTSNKAANTARETLKTTSQQFQLEERPILWATNTLYTPKYDPQYHQIVWDWQYTNYGKTPAKDVRLYEFIRIGNGNWEKPPGASEYSYGAPIPPGKVDYKTMVSPKLTSGEANTLLSEDGGISIKIRIAYKDAFNQSYESQICYIYLKLNASEYCPPDETYMH